MTTTTRNTFDLFPLTADEIRSEADNGLYILYQLDKDRLPAAVCTKLVQIALENEDYILPAQWVVNMIAAFNGLYGLLVNPNSGDASICCYVRNMDAFACMDVSPDPCERNYLNGLLVGMGSR